MSTTTQPRAEFVDVTPEIAREWLKKNTSNRPITKSHVDFLATQMAKGEYEQTGESIQFSDTDRLIDGQHRLSAIVVSGTSQKMLVVWGVKDATQAVIDTNKTRSAGDTLSMNNIANPTIAAAMIKNYMRYKSDITSYGGDKKKFHTNKNVLEVYGSDRELYAKTALLAQQYYKASAGILPASVIGGFFLLFTERSTNGNTRPVREFFDKLLLAKNREHESTITILAKKLTYNKINRVRLPHRELYGMMIKTWNSTIEGVYVKHLAMKADEEIPKILQYPAELFDSREEESSELSDTQGVRNRKKGSLKVA